MPRASRLQRKEKVGGSHTLLQQRSSTSKRSKQYFSIPAISFARFRPSRANVQAFLVQSITDYAIYMLNVDGVITSWNAGVQKVIGYAANDIIGRTFSCFYSVEERLDDHRARDEQVRSRRSASAQGPYALLGACRHRRVARRSRQSLRLRQDPAITPSTGAYVKACGAGPGQRSARTR
nr:MULTISPECIES: PAS domain S-box protein [unclassified Caballeronia]